MESKKDQKYRWLLQEDNEEQWKKKINNLELEYMLPLKLTVLNLVFVMNTDLFQQILVDKT